MDVIKSQTVTRSGTEYVIRAWKESEWFMVRAFQGDQPAGPLYGVTDTTRQDFNVQLGMDAVDELMALAVSHVGEK